MSKYLDMYYKDRMNIHWQYNFTGGMIAGQNRTFDEKYHEKHNIDKLTWYLYKKFWRDPNSSQMNYIQNFDENIFDNEEEATYLIDYGFAELDHDLGEIVINEKEFKRALNETLDIIICNEYMHNYYRNKDWHKLPVEEIASKINKILLDRIKNTPNQGIKKLLEKKIEYMGNESLPNYIQDGIERRGNFFSSVAKDFSKSVSEGRKNGSLSDEDFIKIADRLPDLD